LRDKDENKPVVGFPELPGEWKAYLLKEPITGKIVKVERGGIAIVDVESNIGLKIGMVLVSKDNRAYKSYFKVISVEEDKAKTKVVERGHKSQVAIGRTVSSLILE
jgi:hypothetical protein